MSIILINIVMFHEPFSKEATFFLPSLDLILKGLNNWQFLGETLL